MAKRQRAFTPDTLDDIYSKLDDLSNRIRLLNKTPTAIERLNPVTLPDPAESQLAIDSRTNCFIYYANGAWREKCSAVHAIKVFGDNTSNKVRNGAFRFTVEDDLADTEIDLVRAFNGTVGTGATTIQIVNMTRGINILSAPLSVPSGAETSGLGTINTGGPTANPNNKVFLNDMIWINCTAIGAGSKGLGCYITFHGPKVDVTP
jgi:hypothetical protein